MCDIIDTSTTIYLEIFIEITNILKGGIGINGVVTRS